MMTGPPGKETPPGSGAGGRKKAIAGGRVSRENNTASRAAEQACTLPESAGGSCAYPVTCTCRGLRLFEELFAVATRYDRGRLVVAEALGTDPETIDSLIEHRLFVEAARTPESRAAEAA